MSGQHTPGPWSTYTSSDGARNVKGPGSEFVCAFGCVDSARADPRVESDGRLIAAAPELLAALQAILPHARNWINEHHPTMQQALAAIARAGAAS